MLVSHGFASPAFQRERLRALGSLKRREKLFKNWRVQNPVSNHDLQLAGLR